MTSDVLMCFEGLIIARQGRYIVTSDVLGCFLKLIIAPQGRYIVTRDCGALGEFLGNSDALIRPMNRDLRGSEAPTRLMTRDVGAVNGT